MSSKRSFSQKLGAAIQQFRSVGSLLWEWEARFKGAVIEGTVLFIGRPLLSVAPGSELWVGDGVRLNSSLRSNPLACFQPCVLRTMEQGARLSIGARAGLSGAVVCAAKSVEIGPDTIIGSGAMILDTDFHEPGPDWTWGDAPPESARPIRIGRGVFIGARAIVLKGVTIADRCVVGAGAVVTKDVPAGMMAVGNPARNILMRDRPPSQLT